MYQQTLFDDIETNVSALGEPPDLAGYDFDDIFITTDDLVQEHSKYSLAVLGDAVRVLKKIKNGVVDLIFADAPL